MTAPGYGCALGDETHKVGWLITRLSPAMTISLCDDDFPVGLIPILASELGVDGGRLYETIKRFVDREQARQDKEDAAASQAADRAGPADLHPPGSDSSAGRESEYRAAKALLDDPSTYEDGNTEYGLEQALELARLLVAEYEARP